MKKMLAAMFIVAFVFTAVPAMATTVKVPKEICLSNGTTNFYLAIKAGGKIKMQDGSMAFYDIQGNFSEFGYSVPVVGAGYVKNGEFHFTLSFTIYDGADALLLTFEAYWNPTSGQADMYAYRSFSIPWVATLPSVPCGSNSIPFDAVNEGGTHAEPLILLP